MKQLSFVVLLVLFSAPAMAYVGPGLGMGVIGTIFGVLAAIVLALFGLFWYPLKRAFKKRKAGAQASQVSPAVIENEEAAHPDTFSALTDNQTNTPTDNHVSNHPGAIHEASDTVTASRTDNQVQ